MYIMRILPAAAFAMVFAISTSSAQQPRITGTIARMDGNTLWITTSDNSNVRLTLKDNARIVAIAKGSIEDVRTGSYVSGSAVSGGFGRTKATDLRIYPPSMMPSGGGSSSIGSVVDQLGLSDNREFTLKYNYGNEKIIVDGTTPVSLYGIGDRTELKPGVRINVPAATRLPGGDFETALIRFGRGGFCPECSTTINCTLPRKICANDGSKCCDP